MNSEMVEKINKCLCEQIEKSNKSWKDIINPFLEKARLSIKHPHFYYALVDIGNMTIEYKRKKWHKWFSGKRIVAIKIKPII